MRLLLSLAVLAVLVREAVCGVDVGGVVSVPEFLAAPTMSIILDGEPRVLTRHDGSFVLHDVEEGTHSLEVGTTGWTFPLYSLTVTPSGTVSATFHYRKRQREIKHPLKLEPFAKPSYFEPRKSISIASMFMNPMVLMMLVMGGMAYALPKLQENMDPEELKKMQADMKKSQADQPDPTKMLSGFFGGGAAAGEDSDSD